MFPSSFSSRPSYRWKSVSRVFGSPAKLLRTKSSKTSLPPSSARQKPATCSSPRWARGRCASPYFATSSFSRAAEEAASQAGFSGAAKTGQTMTRDRTATARITPAAALDPRGNRFMAFPLVGCGEGAAGIIAQRPEACRRGRGRAGRVLLPVTPAAEASGGGPGEQPFAGGPVGRVAGEAPEGGVRAEGIAARRPRDAGPRGGPGRPGAAASRSCRRPRPPRPVSQRGAPCPRHRRGARRRLPRGTPGRGRCLSSAAAGRWERNGDCGSRGSRRCGRRRGRWTGRSRPPDRRDRRRRAPPAAWPARPFSPPRCRRRRDRSRSPPPPRGRASRPLRAARRDSRRISRSGSPCRSGWGVP